MHREDIKAALRKKGHTLKDVAQRLSVDSSTVSGVLGGRRSRRVEHEVAMMLGKTAPEIWPDRYEGHLI